ncbi:MAG: RNA polymerase sigma factor [Saprospiraceae bacterium]
MLDPNIIIGCKRQQAAAQRRLFAHFAPVMMTAARRYATDWAEAEDILQEAFVKVFRSFEQFNPEKGALEAWIRRIVVNTAIQHWHRWRKDRATVSDEILASQPVEFDPDSPLTEEEILAHIAALPPGFRMVFNLYAIEGYAHAEIAEMLGITESASRSQLARARQQLQRVMLEKEKMGIGD